MRDTSNKNNIDISRVLYHNSIYGHGLLKAQQETSVTLNESIFSCSLLSRESEPSFLSLNNETNAQQKALLSALSKTITMFSIHEFSHILLSERNGESQEALFKPLKSPDTDLSPWLSESELVAQLGDNHSSYSPVLLSINHTTKLEQLRLELSVEIDIENNLINWRYCNASFSEAFVASLHQDFQRKLNGLILGQTDEQINIELTRLAEQKTHTHTASAGARHKCVHHWFSDRVKHLPHKVALIVEDSQLTYKELETLSNQTANYLFDEGTRAQDVIAICMDRDINSIVSILATLKSGATYLPIDPNNPDTRLAHILSDSKPEKIITSSAYRSKLENLSDTRIVTIDAEETIRDISEKSDELLLPALSSKKDYPAYIIYTSGSTGLPKGVPQSHGNLNDLIHNSMARWDLTSEDCWAITNSFSFDFSVWELWGALLTGSTLIVPRQETVKDVRQLLSLCKEHNITILNQTPGYFRNFVTTIETSEVTLPHLRTIFLGGEEIDKQTLRKWQGICSLNPIRTVVLYGITECTIISTGDIIDNENLDSRLIGQEFDGQPMYLLDESMTPVPYGAVGELYIAGRLTTGYLNNAGLTSERFTPNPFAVTPDSISAFPVIYRTGDLAVQTPNEQYLFLGRKDQQIKIRGYRVEISEIEHQLNQHPEILEAKISLKEFSNADSQLVAHLICSCVPDKISDTLLLSIQEHVKSSLPSHMRPSLVGFVETWPLTVNGKINHSALPEPKSLHQAGLNESDDQALSDTEKKLASIWAGLLDIKPESLSRKSNFFDLGGHSLLLTQVIAGLFKEFEVELDFQQLFTAETLMETAALIDDQYIEI